MFYYIILKIHRIFYLYFNVNPRIKFEIHRLGIQCILVDQIQCVSNLLVTTLSSIDDKFNYFLIKGWIYVTIKILFIIYVYLC